MTLLFALVTIIFVLVTMLRVVTYSFCALRSAPGRRTS